MHFQLIIDKQKSEIVSVRAHRPSALTDQIEALVLGAADEEGHISAYTEDEMKLLPFAQIECITIQGGKTYAVDSHGIHYRLKQRLYELEERLPEGFIRINKSAIANEKALQKFTTAFNGSVDAVFRCGYREYVSRRCFATIKRRFGL